MRQTGLPQHYVKLFGDAAIAALARGTAANPESEALLDLSSQRLRHTGMAELAQAIEAPRDVHVWRHSILSSCLLAQAIEAAQAAGTAMPRCHLTPGVCNAVSTPGS